MTLEPEDLVWLDELLSDSRAVAEQLLWEPAFSLAELLDQVRAYGTAIVAAGDQADQEFGAALVSGATALLEHVGSGSDTTHQRLAQVAARYFVMDDDGDDDLASQFGFDDDVEVFNAIVGHIGLDALRIS